MIKDFTIIDDHIHYALPLKVSDVDDVLKETYTDKGVLVTVPDRQRVLVTPEALLVKAHNPNNLYVFTSLDVSEYFKHPKNVGKYFAKHVERMLKAGCDGVKIIEGKPNMRKLLPIKDFDDPCWEDFFAYAELKQVPILWHVNDPEEFWDKDKIPEWALKRGWFYDESYINNEKQYSQILNVLDRHPNLKITFAHFFFMSAQLDRLQDIFDKYPNVAVDLTPGIEMYINFSKNPSKTREFFIKNAGRILYGTDIGAGAVLGGDKDMNVKGGIARSSIINHFLTSKEEKVIQADGDFLRDIDDFILRGIDLPNEVIRKIYSENFLRRVGNSNKLNKKLIIKECKRIKLTIFIMSFIDKNIKPDYSYVNSVMAYFKKVKEVK